MGSQFIRCPSHNFHLAVKDITSRDFLWMDGIKSIIEKMGFPFWQARLRNMTGLVDLKWIYKRWSFVKTTLECYIEIRGHLHDLNKAEIDTPLLLGRQEHVIGILIQKYRTVEYKIFCSSWTEPASLPRAIPFWLWYSHSSTSGNEWSTWGKFRHRSKCSFWKCCRQAECVVKVKS